MKTQSFTDRKKSTLWNLISSADTDKIGAQILLAPDDQGVIRNGGRFGARYGPHAIIHQLKKMQKNSLELPISVNNYWDSQLATCSFDKAQELAATALTQILSKKPTIPIFHLGGGHDHIYPLLKALEKMGADKITVLNIDAHCDTREDALAHSGTPFRQFSLETQSDFNLYQIGIHRSSNSPTTLAPLKKGTMHIKEFRDLGHENIWDFLAKNILPSPSTTFVLSLDCDAFDCSVMKGVSAPNHQGFDYRTVAQIFDFYDKQLSASRKIFGIYEYNPIFDDLSNQGAGTIATLMHNALQMRSLSLN